MPQEGPNERPKPTWTITKKVLQMGLFRWKPTEGPKHNKPTHHQSKPQCLNDLIVIEALSLLLNIVAGSLPYIKICSMLFPFAKALLCYLCHKWIKTKLFSETNRYGLSYCTGFGLAVLIRLPRCDEGPTNDALLTKPRAFPWDKGFKTRTQRWPTKKRAPKLLPFSILVKACLQGLLVTIW